MSIFTLLGAVAASAGDSLFPHSKTFTITCGEYGVSKIGTWRGYGNLFGSINETRFGHLYVSDIAVNRMESGANGFSISLRGAGPYPTIRAIPQNYGGSLSANSGDIYPGVSAIYSWALPNMNLFNNWAPGQARACTIELA